MRSPSSSSAPSSNGPSVAGTVARLALLDLRLLLSERSTWVWAFVMPPLFFFFFGAMTGGSGGAEAGGDPAPEVLVLVTAPEAGSASDPATDRDNWLLGPLTRRLEEMDFAVVPPDSDRAGDAVAQLTVPAATTARALAGEQTVLLFEPAGSGLRADERTFRVQRAVWTALGDWVAAEAVRTRGLSAEQAAAESERPLAAADLERLRAMPRSIELDVSPAGRRLTIPSGYEQAVPGNLVMFVLLVMLSVGASTLVEERQRGVLRRLASSPIGRSGTVVAKGLSRFALGLIQVAVAVAVGTVFFQMDWGPHGPLVFVVLAAWVAFSVALCLLLAQFGRTPGHTSTLGVLASLLLAALGGSWWPTEIAPGWMQQIATILPSGWTMDALHRLISFQTGSVAPQLAALAVATVACAALAARRFRFL